MLDVIKKLLQGVIDDIDAGNTNITEDEGIEIIHALRELRMDKPMSKYQAYTYLNISRATFDNYVKEGKLPQGKKIEGFKELFWNKKELNKAKKLWKVKN